MNTKRRAHCQLWHDWKERIIRIGDEQTSLQNQFDNIRNEFTDNSPRIEALETDVNALDGRLIIAESDIADAEDRITACENDIDRIDAELIDKTGEINNLSNRMTLAEADIDDLDARLEGIEAGEILLSQLDVDADKNWQGRTIRNVQISEKDCLWDGQLEIEYQRLKGTALTNPISFISDGDAPYNTYARITGQALIGNRFGALYPPVPAVKTERLYVECWVRLNSEPPAKAMIELTLYQDRYDENLWAGAQITKTITTPNTWVKVDGYIVLSTNPGYKASFRPYMRVNYNQPDQINTVVDICGWRYSRVIDRDVTAKIISADGVIIKDGGTVDGVDISTHTHDGTAIGGPKISYNNLTDKPTIPTKLSQLATDENNQRVSAAEKAEWNRISTHTHDGTTVGGPKISYNDLVDKPDIPTSLPKPPMPYKKTVSINLGDSIHVLDIIPEGRTALTVEQLQYREIANIAEGTGQFVDIGIRCDDNTIYSGIDRITKNGDTDWHPPTFPAYNPGYLYTKNYIIGIRITRSPHEGPNITGYVDIFGHVY